MRPILETRCHRSSLGDEDQPVAPTAVYVDAPEPLRRYIRVSVDGSVLGTAGSWLDHKAGTFTVELAFDGDVGQYRVAANVVTTVELLAGSRTVISLPTVPAIERILRTSSAAVMNAPGASAPSWTFLVGQPMPHEPAGRSSSLKQRRMP